MSPLRVRAVELYRHKIIAWYSENARAFPWRRTRDPYRVLVGELLLQRTRGEAVAPVYREFVRIWPDPHRLARARVSTLRRVLRPLGLTKRADLLLRLGQALDDAAEIPRDVGKLMELPGVGPYTAHAVAVFAYELDLPLVDWVIGRVLRRYFGVGGQRRPNADTELWNLASELAKPGRAREVWLGSLDLASDICKKRPRCQVCPLSDGCTYAGSMGRTVQQ